MSKGMKEFIVGAFAVIVIIAVIIGGIFGLLAVGKAFGRSQAQADAKNKVQITHIEIKRQHEYAEIVHAQTEAVQAEREQRVVRAKGIQEAQKLIAKTLTPEYIQFEAIEAQKAIATSGQNNTVIYVPAGTNGTPVITQSAAGSHTAAVPGR